MFDPLKINWWTVPEIQSSQETISQQEWAWIINWVDYKEQLKADIEKSKWEPEWKKLWFENQDEKDLADFMKEKGYSFEDYQSVRWQYNTQQEQMKEENDERSFFQKLYVEPMKQEDWVDDEDIVSMTNVKNIWEWFGKNVLGWIANIITWLWDLWTKAVGWTFDYGWELITWKKSLDEIKQDLEDAWAKTKEVAWLLAKYYVDTYWSWEWFQKWAFENPTGMIWDFLTVISAWTYWAAKLNSIQQASLMAQRWAFFDALTRPWLTISQKAKVMKNIQNISLQIATKTTKARTLAQWLTIANKYNPYIAWPKLAYQTWKLGLKVVWKWLGAVKNMMPTSTKWIASTLKLKPTDMARINNMLGKNWDFTKWLQEKWIISWVKASEWRKWILDKLRDFNTKAYESLQTRLAKVQWKYTNENVMKALEALHKEVAWVAWLEDDVLKIEKLINKYTTNNWLSLHEIHWIKKMMDDTLSIYKNSWLVKESVTKQWLANIRKWLREFIETTGAENWLDDIYRMSQDIRVSRWLADALENRITTQWLNDMLSLTDKVLMSVWWVWLATWADMWTISSMFIMKKLMESAAFKIKVVQMWEKAQRLINKVKSGANLTQMEKAWYVSIMTKYIKERWAVIKRDINEIADAFEIKKPFKETWWTPATVIKQQADLDFSKKWSFIKFKWDDADYMIASPQNPMWTRVADEINAANTQKFSEYLDSRWIKYKIQDWMYDNPEQSFLIKIDKPTDRVVVDKWLEKNAPQAENLLIRDWQVVRYDPRTWKAYSTRIDKTDINLNAEWATNYYSVIDWRKYSFPLYWSEEQLMSKAEFYDFYRWTNKFQQTQERINLWKSYNPQQERADLILFNQWETVAWEVWVKWALTTDESLNKKKIWQKEKAQYNTPEQQKKRLDTTEQEVPSWNKHRYLDEAWKEQVIPKLYSKEVNIWDAKQVDELYNYYVETYHNWTKSIVVDSDNIKKLFADFNPDAPELVHDTSSNLSSKFFEKALETNPTEKVVFTAWGWWSWKSEVLIKNILWEWDAIIFDWTWKNYEKMIKMYNQAKAAWKQASIEWVYVDFRDAQIFNNMRDRTVPLDILIDTHSWFRQTLLKIMKEHPEIETKLVWNTWRLWKNWKPIWFEIPNERKIEFLETHLLLE